MRISAINSQILWIFAILTSAAAQSGEFPRCALLCALPTYGIVITGCETTDFACVCRNSEYQESVRPCIKARCSASEYDQTLKAAQILCDEAGVVLFSTPSNGVSSTTSLWSTSIPPSANPESTTATLNSRQSSDTPTQPPPSSRTLPIDRPSGNPASGGDSNLSTMGIAAIVVGIVVPLVSLIVCLYIFYRVMGQKQGTPAISANEVPVIHYWG
ncbi:hypothetical protein TWF281_011232 [Arthrobotrys megalospora]